MCFSGLPLRPVALAVFFLSIQTAQAQDEVIFQVERESQKSNSEASSTVRLPEVEVIAESLESRVYSRQEMDATAAGNRDLTSLIANHPAVRTNPTSDAGNNRGSLAPESFSIHGESPYQNQFLLDGVSATNNINPQENELGMKIGRVPGFSQAYNLDTDLLDMVKVYDNRVPVEFGQFQGGVVDARIKNPKGDNKFSLNHSFNSSNITKQRIELSKNPEVSFNNGAAGNSPAWKKNFSSFQGDVGLNESSALLLAFSRRESNIQRTSRRLDLTKSIPDLKTTKITVSDEKDSVDNFFAKVATKIGGGMDANILFKYADRREDLLNTLGTSIFTDSSWTNRQKSMGLGFDIGNSFVGGKIKTTFSYDQMDALRESDETEFITQSFWSGSGYGAYTSGALGDESLEQRQYSAKTRMDWDSFFSGVIQHKIYGGIDLQYTNARFYRHQDAFSGTQQLQSNGAQQVTQRIKYHAGTVDAGFSNISAYVSDSMQWENLSLTAGLRVERDSFLNNINYAPRLRIDWDVFEENNTQIGLGWSKYYGLNIMGYALEEGKDRLKEKLPTISVPNPTQDSIAGRNFEGLKTPYSNEWVLSLNHNINYYFQAGFSYVRRASRDGLRQQGKSATGYFYTNDAKSDAETIALSLVTLKPWKAIGADWTGRLDFSWQQSHKNHDAYAGWEAGELAPDDVVKVNGLTMFRKDMPSAEYSLPRRVSMTWTGQWKNSGVTWGNRLNWLSAREGLAATDTDYKTYVTNHLPSQWTWDVSLTYKPFSIKGVTLNVDIMNILNKQESLALSSISGLSYTRYQTGREIWLNVGYEF